MGVHIVGDNWKPPVRPAPWENPFLALTGAQQEAVRRLMVDAWHEGFDTGYEEGYCAKAGIVFDKDAECPYA